MKAETKEQRFKRIAEKRVQRVLDALRSLSQTSNKRMYQWSDQQMKKIWDAIAENEFETIRGPIRFKGTENVITSAKILQFQKGELEVVYPAESVTAKPLYPKPQWPQKSK